MHCHTRFPIGYYTKTEIIRRRRKKHSKRKAIGNDVVDVIFIMPKNIKKIKINQNAHENNKLRAAYA
jgi:hypothetical protein